MTNEEIQLLLQEFCVRLRYGVVYHRNDGANIKLNAIDVERGLLNYTDDIDEKECKPYLRPMESMTEEEREEWFKQSHVEYDCEFHTEPTLSLCDCHLSTDWLNKKMFDYRGLIPMGLALPATEDMYKIN